MGSKGHGAATQLPRTTPHISSTQHRLVRQGHQPKDVTLTADQYAAPSSTLSPSSLSNFRDASSSRSVTPHPFLPVTTGHSSQTVQKPGETGALRENRHGYHLPTSTNLTSVSQMMTGKHSPQPSVYQRSGLAGSSAKMGQPKGTYQSRAEGRGGRERGGGCASGIAAPLNPVGCGSNPSAAASFFARAAQKVGASSKTKKHRTVSKEKATAPFPTTFSTVIVKSPPPVPRNLLCPIGRTQNALSGKVRVMLRVCPVEGAHSSFLTINSHKNQVTTYDPSNYGHSTSSCRRHLPPKMFGFDAVFMPNDPLSDICAVSLVDILQAVVGGADGCLFCYGHSRIGKTYTMVGDESPLRLGIIPCAISWLFRLINEQKEHTGARFSVRVSATEVTGKHEILKDLLADIASTAEVSTTPGMYLREDPVCGTQLENQSELRAPTAERAAYFLDAAIAARTVPEADEDARNSHLLFTIHVYQYRVETSSEGQNGVAGGRSRLHLIDFGSCSRTREGSALSLSALGTVIMALLNGQRHVPYRESTLTQLVKEALGSLSCHACMIVHVSPAIQAYNESLQVMQLATRLQRMRTKRRSKFSSTSSEDSSCDNKRIRSRMRLGVRMGTLSEGSVCSTDYTSSSEQSCDTVIFLGDNVRSLSDQDFTDCEGTRMSAIPYPQFTSPSGLVKMSALSRVDEVIEARHGSGERLFSMPPYAPPYSSCGSLIPQSKNPAFRSRFNKIGRNYTEQEMPDVDTCKTRDIRVNRSHGEQWVDGPESIYKGPVSRDSEQWVDGPPEFQKNMKSEEPTASSSSSKGGLSYAEPKALAVNKFHASVIGISRLPHKAARTAKIAMLYRRESSPSEIEQGNSQSKSFPNEVEQEERNLNDRQNIQNYSGAAISKESNNTAYQHSEIASDSVYDLLPSDDNADEDSEYSMINTTPDSHACEKGGVDLDAKVNNNDVMIGDNEAASNDNYSSEMKSQVMLDENINNYNPLVDKNKLRKNVSADLLDGEEKGQVMEVDDVRKNECKIAVDIEVRIPSIAAGNMTDSLDIRDGSNRSCSAKLNVESLLLDSRESIYELQMDQELERGSRESLQRLIYGSDDDSAAWYSEPHSLDMDESCEWLKEMSLDALNDSVRQNFKEQNNAKAENETRTDCTMGSCYLDDHDKTLSSAEAGTFVLPFEASETVTTGSLLATDTSVSFVESNRKASPDSTLSFSVENECSIKEHCEVDVTGPAVSADVLIPRSASTPVKASNLKLPIQAMCSKIPESVQKSDHNKKPPRIPHTSFLIKNKNCISSDQIISASSVQETSSEMHSSKMQSLPSLSKDSSPCHKKIEEKANSGVKKLANVGLRPGHKSQTNPTAVKSNSASPTIRKTSKSTVCLPASQKIPLLTSRSSLTLAGSPKQSKQQPKATKKSRQSVKAGSELPCARLEAPSSMPSTVLQNGRSLLSPYHMVTKPRASVHSSGCHGSDYSSATENVVTKATSGTSEVEASSGYESMIRDSEFTGTSSSQDSNSESASTGKARGIKIFRKRAKGRSRSAPARWFSAEGTIRVSRRMFPLSRPEGSFYCTGSVPEEPLEIKTFNSEDVERMSRWRNKEAELQSLQERRCRIQELLDIQATLKRNLARSKEILMVDPESWSYDLHIADNMSRDDPSYLQALEKETAILKKRIWACKSRIMMVTCFDVTA